MSEEYFSIRDLRKEMGLTLAELGVRVGISSQGHMSDVERGEACSVKVALAIEALSGGRIDAARLSGDVALVVAAKCGFHDEADTADELTPSPGKSDDFTAQVAA